MSLLLAPTRSADGQRQRRLTEAKQT